MRKRLLPITAALAALVVVLAACARGPQIQVGSGTLGSGPWSAWVYDSYTSGVCFEIRESGRDPDRLCGLTVDNTGIWRPRSDAGDATLLAGTTADTKAEQARVALGGGGQVEAEAQAAAEVSPLRFFVLLIPAGANAQQLDLLDGSGAVLDSQPLE